MGLLNIIRRMSLREKLSIREISRRTGLSRNTITKHLNSGTIEPQFTAPDRQSKLDLFADKLAGWLKTEAGKSRKQRRTAKQLHEDLVKLGYTGSYNRVAAFARDWRSDRQQESQTTGRGTFGPVAYLCRSKCSFKPPSVQKRPDFSIPMLSAGAEGYRTR
jgi:DNA-binding transcriptional ArsR family regulator